MRDFCGLEGLGIVNGDDGLGLFVRRFMKNITWRVIQTSPFDGVRPRICHGTTFMFEGKTRRSGRALSAVVFAGKEVAEYFCNLAYQEHTRKALGKKTYSDIPSLVDKLKPDMVFVESAEIFSDYLLSNNLIKLPLVYFDLDISSSLSLIYARMNHNNRTILHQMNKIGYTYEITNDIKQLKFFYDELYVPHVLKKYGKSAKIVPFYECKNLFRKGGLLLVKLGDEYVSGNLYTFKAEELQNLILGLRDQYVRKKAGPAALYFSILWARQLGCKRMDFGTNMPFLTDGVFQYKKRWGMSLRPVTGKNAKILSLGFSNFGDGVRDFLSDNPFIFADSNDLKGLAVVDPDDVSISPDYHVPGLSGLTILYPPCPSVVPQPLLSEISFLGDGLNDRSSPIDNLVKMAQEKGYKKHQINYSMVAAKLQSRPD